ncbi:hypothetical protein D3C72_1570770 [compost metagenome]
MLLVADRNNHCIRSIEIDDTNVSVLVGKGMAAGTKDGDIALAAFNQPITVMADPTNANFVYVGEAGNFRVRRIQLTVPLGVSTVLGKETANTGTGGRQSAAFTSAVALTISTVGGKKHIYVYDAGPVPPANPTGDVSGPRIMRIVEQ